ncbi:MAG: alpha/beta hydrolase [Pseudomonadota bacterium]
MLSTGSVFSSSFKEYATGERSKARHTLAAIALLLSAFSTQALEINSKTITLQAGGELSFEAGYVNVPENRSVADSRMIQVAFYRFKADEGVDGAPMVVLPGGPGGSYTQRLESERSQPFAVNIIETFRDHGDVIFVDLRGIALSKPNTVCEGPSSKFRTLFTLTDLKSVFQDSARTCREKLLQEGFDLEGYTVIEAAADVVAVIDALGYQTFRLYGNSFGSHWSLTTLRYHADRVERAIISGTEGYDHTWDHPAGLRRAAEMISEAATPAWQAAGREGSPLSTLDALLDKAQRDSDLAHGIQAHEVALLGLSGQGFALSGRESVKGWPAAVAELDDGEGWLMRWGFRLLGAWFLGGESESAAAVGTLDCASGLSAERRAEMEAIDDPLFSQAAFFNYDSICPAWAVPALPDAFRAGEQIDVPVLFVHGDVDFSTPLQNAYETLEAFPNGHLVVMENGTHGAFPVGIEISETLQGVVDDWLQGTPPAVERIALPPLEFDPVPSP